MIPLDYTSLAETPLAVEPFPHLVIPGFVPPDSLTGPPCRR